MGQLLLNRLLGFFTILLCYIFFTSGCPLRDVAVHTGQGTGTRDDVPISRRSVLDEGLISVFMVVSL